MGMTKTDLHARADRIYGHDADLRNRLGKLFAEADKISKLPAIAWNRGLQVELRRRVYLIADSLQLSAIGVMQVYRTW